MVSDQILDTYSDDLHSYLRGQWSWDTPRSNGDLVCRIE